jgi:hypothetical protein
MRFLYALLAFTFTMVLGLIAFTYTSINFSITMRDLLVSVQQVHDQLPQLFVLDNYMAWVDNLLQPNLIVLVGFTIVMRILLEVVSSVFSSGPDVPDLDDAAPSGSPFGRWG